MRSCLSETIGSVVGGPYNNRFMPFPWNPPQAFKSTVEYLDYRGIFLNICGPWYVEEQFSHFPTDTRVHPIHGDLLPQNTLVDRSKITAIVDWETGGYYPEFWEYCRIHDLGLTTPGWEHALARIFPGPRLEKETNAVARIVRYTNQNRESTPAKCNRIRDLW